MYSASLQCPANLSEADLQILTSALEDDGRALSASRIDNDDEKPWIISIITEISPDLNALSNTLNIMAETCGVSALKTVKESDWRIEQLPDIDWLEHSYQQNPPIEIGPFFFYGSHYKGEKPHDKISLLIDAASAFGSGDHGTTKGCLLAMEMLDKQGVCPWNVLDMGTGSGILSLAAWRMWKAPVLAIDIEEQAITVASNHAKENKIPLGAGYVTAIAGDGFNAPVVAEKAPYELIIANILASVLRTMPEQMKAVSDENGYLILSGILEHQADEISKLYTEHGFSETHRRTIDEWSTLIMRNMNT